MVKTNHVHAENKSHFRDTSAHKCIYKDSGRSTQRIYCFYIQKTNG